VDPVVIGLVVEVAIGMVTVVGVVGESPAVLQAATIIISATASRDRAANTGRSVPERYGRAGILPVQCCV